MGKRVFERTIEIEIESNGKQVKMFIMKGS